MTAVRTTPPPRGPLPRERSGAFHLLMWVLPLPKEVGPIGKVFNLFMFKDNTRSRTYKGWGVCTVSPDSHQSPPPYFITADFSILGQFFSLVVPLDRETMKVFKCFHTSSAFAVAKT